MRIQKAFSMKTRFPKPIKSRRLRLEALEERQMLAVNPAVFHEVRAAYPDLNLEASMADQYNVIEITADELSDASLRAAITEAGTTAENDLIVVRTTYTQNKITLGGTELTININAATRGSVAIVSLGTEKLTIDANQRSRVINIINSSSVAVALAGLTITGGQNVATGATGGGIFSHNGTLIVTNCTINDNKVLGNNGVGGGIYSYGGTLTVMNSTISGNLSVHHGGGIYCGNSSMLTNCTISENTTNRNGGGVYNVGTLEVVGCTISGNTAFMGGGLHCESEFSTVTMVNSTISGNTTVNQSGGGIYNARGSMELANCAIIGNTMTNGSGGIYSYGGNMTLTNGVVSYSYFEKYSGSPRFVK